MGVRSVLGVEKAFDAYMKKTIKNTVLKYAQQEILKRHREMSLELIKTDISDNTSLSFSFGNNIEELFEDSKLAGIISELPEQKKRILKLKYVDNYNSKEIAQIVGKSDSRIRNIINDTLKEIRKQYEE